MKDVTKVSQNLFLQEQSFIVILWHRDSFKVRSGENGRKGENSFRNE